MKPRLFACLAAVYIIWSSTYWALREAVKYLPPLEMAAVRYGIAGVILLGIGWARTRRFPTAREWLAVAPVGALLFVGGNGFVAIAEATVSSGGAAVVCATMPLWVGVLGIFANEPPSRREWLVLALGFAGVLVLMGSPSLSGKPAHVVLILFAPITWALGSLLARKLPPTLRSDAPALAGTQMITGAIALVIGGVIHGEHWQPLATTPTSAWLALAYLVVAGSLIAFTAYAWLLANTTAVIATSYAYVNPTLAVLLGAAVANEQLGPLTLVANVLIVAAVVLALRKPKR